MSSYSRGRFEFFLVASLIALITAIALVYYGSLAQDAKRLQFKVLASHFATGLASARVAWIVKSRTAANGLPPGYVTQGIAGRDFYFSAQGWPISSAGPVVEGSLPSAEDCQLLWQGLLQNPPKLAVDLSVPQQAEYGVSRQPDSCRYFWLNTSAELDESVLYFDYFPADGSLVLGPGL